MRASAGPPEPRPASDVGAFFLLTHYLGASVFWASGLLFIKLSPGLSPLALSACRGLLAMLSLGLWFRLQGVSLRPRRGELGQWLVLGCINGWIPNVLTTYALASITAAQGSMIQASTPLMVAAIAHVLFADERLTPRRIGGVAVGFAGMMMLIGPAAVGAGGASASGAIAMVGAAACYAAGSLYVRSIPVADPSRLAFGQQLFSGFPALALALGLEGAAGFASLPANLLPVLALGVLATAVPNVFYMRLIRRAGPTRSSMVSYLIPLWASLMGIVFLAESVGPREVAAGGVILLGVYLVSGRRPGPTASQQPARS
jgi:drug/metabolite transporter (DMT)-like permease